MYRCIQSYKHCQTCFNGVIALFKKKRKEKKRGEGDQEHVRVEMLLTIDPVLLHSIVKYILHLRKDTDINTIKYNLNYHSGYIILPAC